MERKQPTTRLPSEASSVPHKSAYSHNVFPVAAVENGSANRCKLTGLYELHIGALSLTLHNITTKQVVYTWPYKHIRRYGRSSNNFQFEAGRKCQSGEGLFSLITEEGAGESLFIQISKRFDEIRRNKFSSECSSSGGSSTESDSEAPQIYEEAPALPPRNYKSDTLKSLFTKRAAKKAPKLKMSRATKEAGTPRSMSTQESHYDEIDLYKEETVSKSASPTVSASVINSLIRRHKDTLMGKPQPQKQPPTSSNNNTRSADDQEGVYHVLHDLRKKLPSEDFYSEVN